MTLSKNKYCYYCDKSATTKDHIPPKCFFPKDYRNNLITVPSCSEHNNHRSKDDEYTAAVIVMNSRSRLASTIFKSKGLKTLCRRDGKLGKRIFSTARSARVIYQKNSILIPAKTLAIPYEIERINRVIESIARALYYHESGYQKKWKKSIIIKSLNFLNRNLGKPSDSDFLESVNQNFIHGEKFQKLGLEEKGSHPDVFYYQIFKSKEDETHTIRMVFYGDFTFLAILKEEDTTFNRIEI